MLDKTISIRIDEDVYNDLVNLANKKAATSQENYNMTDIVREFISDGLEQNNKKILVNNDYVPIGREILMVDRMIGARNKSAVYNRDISAKSYLIPKRGRVPEKIIEEENFYVPFFRIATNPMWDIDDDYLSDSIIKKSKETIRMNEDAEIIKLLKCSVEIDEYIKEISLSDDVKIKNNSWPGRGEHVFEGDDIKIFYNAYNSITEHQLNVKNIICNPIDINKVTDFNKSLKEKNKEELNILQSIMCPKNNIFMTAAPEYVGIIAIKHDITMADCNEPKIFKNGKIIWETIGISVVNDYAISAVITESNTNSIEEKQSKQGILDETEE